MEIEDGRREEDAVERVHDAAHAGQKGARILGLAEALHERLGEVADLPHHAEKDAQDGQMHLVPLARKVTEEKERDDEAQRQAAEEAFDRFFRGNMRDERMPAEERTETV